jgi:hypothetical protein
MKSSIFLTLALGAASVSTVSAQDNAPDALHYEDYKDIYQQFEPIPRSTDSLMNKFRSYSPDSIKVNADGSITGYGTIPNGMMPNGILLDNRSESDGYIYNGTRYFIRNMKPKIEPKEVTPGSNIYRLK